MYLADDYLKQIQLIIEDCQTKKKQLEERYSICDKEINDLYHQIEMSNFNACEGYFYSKRLQEVLRKRRSIKEELHKLQSFNDNMNLAHLTNSVNKTKKRLKQKERESSSWQRNWKYTYTIEELIG